MVPNGWNRIALEKIAEVRSGVAKGKKGLKAPIEVPYLRVANVQDGHVDLTEVKTIEIEQDKLERYSLKYGDVLMNEGGDYDKLGRGDVWLGQIEPCLHQNHVFAVRPNQDIVDSFFLAALAASNYGKTYFLSCAKRSTNLASINSTQIKEFPVLVPPLPEQKKIAQILSTWDKAITTTEQLLANSQQQKKALMQQLLTGKKRLLDKNGVRFSGEWKYVEIGRVLKEVKRPVDWDDDAEYKLLSVKRRSEGVVLREVLKGSDILTKKMNVAHSGDFLISKMQIVHGAAGLVSDEFDGFHVSDSYISLIPKDESKLNIHFFAWFAKQKLMYHKAFLCSYGVHIEKMTFNFKLFLKEKIRVPVSIEEQQKIAAILSSADQEISALQQKLDALKQEKKALMQQLLTGKRRVLVS
ncbi:restriction endonuclease subunit S [Vibrio cholerae]|nr:restriction endonuclease subunit S [Vibrio cholerae]EKG0012930.1 restriction endonuclease subunit S [Vibrio cholerae]